MGGRFLGMRAVSTVSVESFCLEFDKPCPGEVSWSGKVYSKIGSCSAITKVSRLEIYFRYGPTLVGNYKDATTLIL
jgi:hypothetical protein